MAAFYLHRNFAKRMTSYFSDFDLSNFWEDSDYARKSYVEEKPTPELIQAIEQELGYRLPASYIALMNTQNGGIPRNRCFPTTKRTSWSENHVAITGIMGIGRTKAHSICGDLGSQFMQEEWGYPVFGICICDCPSAGHDMIMLDYRNCGKDGEPSVIHVDQERDYKITFLASDFESFIRGLVNQSVYDTSAADLEKALQRIDTGAFSPLLSQLISNCHEADYGSILRKLCRAIAKVKGHFSLHADEHSQLVYDLQLYLYSHSHSNVTEEQFLEIYPELIAMCDADFSTGGYAPDFVADWLRSCLANGELLKVPAGLKFSDGFVETIKARLVPFQK